MPEFCGSGSGDLQFPSEFFGSSLAPKGFGEITNSKYQITNGWRVDFNKVLQLVHLFVAFIASCEAELL